MAVVETIQDVELRRSVRNAALTLVWLPTIAFCAALLWAIVRPIGLMDVLLLVSMVTISNGIGISVGYHRFLTHRAFEADRWVAVLLCIAGAMAFQGPPVYWVSLHRKHHEHSDALGDPHSPRALGEGWRSWLRGLWHGHFGWLMSPEVPNTLHYAPDLLKDRTVAWTQRHYLAIALAGLFVPAVIGGACDQSLYGAAAGLLWGGLVRVFVANQLIWGVNSFCHALGFQPYRTRDNSRNIGALALLTFGESYHNNHHAFPTSARIGLHWWQLDLGYAFIRALEALGSVRAVKAASRAEVALRTAHT